MFPTLRPCRFVLILVALAASFAVAANDVDKPAPRGQGETVTEMPRTGLADSTTGGTATAESPRSDPPPYGVGFEARRRALERGGFGNFDGHAGRRGPMGGGRGRGR